VGASPLLSRIRRPAWVTTANVVLGLFLLCLLLLPVVLLGTLGRMDKSQMELQAREISTLVTDIRRYYSDNVVQRIQESDGKAVLTDRYREIHGGIPIPATLSIELGQLFEQAHDDGRIQYRFISDYPFRGRGARPLDSFELEALSQFRKNPRLQQFTKVQTPLLGEDSYRLATPVLMRKACVTCHNAHPDSPKRDWKLGDVRGIQEITIKDLHTEGGDDFAYLGLYLALVGVTATSAVYLFRRQSARLQRSNGQLLEARHREEAIQQRLRGKVEELSLLASVVDSSTVGVTIADMGQPDTPLIYANQAFYDLTGYGEAETLGRNCRFMRGPLTDPATTATIRQAIANGEPCTAELINYRRDGTPFWNQLTLYPVGGTPGRPKFYVGNQTRIPDPGPPMQAGPPPGEPPPESPVQG
jgi:PAS domain S-box-containing protein